MFKTFVSATALVAALAFSAPSNAQEVMGVIKSYDNGTRVLILEDGTRYVLPENVTVQRYEPGTKVRYVVEDRDGKRVITKIVTTE